MYVSIHLTIHLVNPHLYGGVIHVSIVLRQLVIARLLDPAFWSVHSYYNMIPVIGNGAVSFE